MTKNQSISDKQYSNNNYHYQLPVTNQLSNLNQNVISNNDINNNETQQLPSLSSFHSDVHVHFNFANIQTKLKVNQPGDIYEQEADRMADQVMRTPELSIQRRTDEEEKEGDILHAKPVDGTRVTDGTGVSETLPIIQDVLCSPGQPLDSSIRQIMESRFGHDFSQVRVHTDRQAIESALAVGARAYTVGQDVIFGTGQYTKTHEGQRLIAHELTHVVQQRALRSSNMLQREIIYGSGYPRPYKSDENEIRNAEAKNWSPASIDFTASVKSSGGGKGIDTFRGLLDYIEGRQQGSISELGLLGHSNRKYFGLSGTVRGSDVNFKKEGLIGQQSIKDNLQIINSKQLHNRFADNTKIILYGCKAGTGIDLLDSISQAFKVCVQGFKNEIDFCFNWKPPTGENRHITSRGRINYSPEDPTDPFGLRPEKTCDRYLVDVRQLSPDQESCKGI
jgi:hypothetical protein